MSWDQDDDRPRKRRRRTVNITGPLILITLGLIFLMANLGMLGTSPWQILWQWWPLIFIVIGLEILIGVLGRLSYALSAILGALVVIATLALVAYLLVVGPQLGVGTPEYASRLTQPLGDLTRAEVTLDLSVGTLRVSALPAGSENLLEAAFAGTGEDEPPPVHREFAQTISGVGVLTLRSRGPQVRFFGSQWPAWDVRLSPDVPLTLKVDAVLGTYDLDLRDLQVTDLEMGGVMCTRQVYLPASGSTVARISGVMESLEITVPAGTAARIHAKGLSAIDVTEERFPRRGDVYESTNFSTATNRVEIVIESVMSTVRVR